MLTPGQENTKILENLKESNIKDLEVLAWCDGVAILKSKDIRLLGILNNYKIIRMFKADKDKIQLVFNQWIADKMNGIEHPTVRIENLNIGKDK